MEIAPEELAECPSCHANVGLDESVCPSCGETFSDAVTAEPRTPSYAGGEHPAEGRSTRPRKFREKLLFYLGILLILLGGPGIALGSWLHDLLRINILNGYSAYDVFGPVNRLVVAVGLMVTVVGIVLFILSLRFSRPSAEEREIRESQEM